MQVRDFVNSVNEVQGFVGDRVLDLKIKVDDQTGKSYHIGGRAIINPDEGIAHLFIDTSSTHYHTDAAVAEAADKLDRYQKGQLGSFFTNIFEAISRADPLNLEALRVGFPLEVAAWEKWQSSPEVEP